MQAASGRKTEYRRRRARRASALMVVLALLFTMVPTGFATVAGAAEATETAPSEPPSAPPEPIPEPIPQPPADDTTDDPTNDISDDPADDITDRAAPTATAVAVTCYAAVDGDWKQVGTVQTDKIDSGRYYIMAAELDGIYGGYGFSSANYSGELFFPHTDNNSINTLWADAVPKNIDGAWQIPLSRKGPIYLYYLPGNTAGTSSYFTGSKPKTDAEMLADNMFYTITVEDAAHAVYDTPPAPQVLFHGGTTTVTLNKVEGVTWEAVNGKTNETLSLASTETETTVTYTIENIDAPIRFRPHVAAGMIQYEAMPEGWMSKLGNFDVSRQQAQQTATVRGEAVYMALPAENSHTLLAPDIDRIAVTITDVNNHTMFYSFAGWKVAGAAGSPVLSAGTVLTAEDLNRYADGTGTVTLQAVWSGVDSQNRPNTVHFFLHKNGELKGSVEDGVKPESTKDYTPAIYSTRMMNAGAIPADYTNQGGTPLVARPNADADAYQTNTTIRDMVRTPVYGATLEDLPGDETVFAYLRANKIEMKINGQVVDNDKLNTTYFGIRWNTVKYEPSDGWHIDGVLVAKRTRFFVTKTFAGDAAAIALAKENFTITVSHTEGSSSVTDFTLVPRPKNEVNEAGKLGYTDYDAAAETYTWEVPAQQKRSYTITEAGHIPSGSWRVSNSYAIRNNPDGGATGYLPYPEAGIVITAVGYGDDVPNIAVQTVALRNVYVGVGTLTVNTQDAITGNNLRDIPYRLTRDGTAVTLYRRPGTTLYSMENDPDYTETIPNGTLTAGANGLFTIRLETGTYTLTETLPTGYYGPGTVQVTVTKPTADTITYHSVAQNLPTEVTTPAGGWLKDADTDHITILNVPRMLISVTARSSWPENGEKLPVTVQLWCDGTMVPGDQYTQELTEANKWEYTWEELPLFTNGTVARYTLRVTKIGNTYRDAALGGDGFADYDVTNDAVKYRQTGDPAYRDEHMWEEDGVQHFAQEALLVVRNEGVRGAVVFTKADEKDRPLKGAEFTLYTDAACTNPLATATSNEDGEVRFAPQPGGTYYLKETKAPQGHTAENTVWTVKISGGKATITTSTGAVITSVRNTSLLQLTLRVLGPEGEPLPGTKLRVTWDTVQRPEYTTGTDGTVVLPKLPNGDYTVRLMNTPTGYLPQVSVPELNAQYGEITLTSGDDAWKLENTAEGYLLTLRLQALYTLPTTGGTGTAAFTAAGVLLMGLAAAMLCRKKQVE